MSIPETIPDKIVVINNFKEGCEKSITFKIRIDEIRTMRNKLLKDSDYYLLPDIGLTDQKLNDIKFVPVALASGIFFTCFVAAAA